MPNSVTIIIPAYNEEQSIAPVIDEIQEVLTKNNLQFPIIVIDDGSTDKTADMVKSKNVTLFRHADNRGYGAALKTGIRNANTEFVLIMDADGTYPAETIPQLLEDVDTNDMIVAKRDKAPPSRRFAKWVLVKLANYLAETKIPDLNSGMRLIRKSVLERFWSILPNGFSFTTTITLSMLCNGYQVKYVPIVYRDRAGKSKISPVKNTLDFIVLIIRTMVYFNPLRVFLPVGFFMVIFGIGFGFYTKFVLDQLYRVTTTTLVTTGVQILMMGFLADLIVRRSK